MNSKFVQKWHLISADRHRKWELSPGVLHNLIEEACEEIERLYEVARAAKQVLDHDLYGHNETMLREALEVLDDQDNT